MLSESGRYLAYVLYSEDDEKYFLVIYDLLDGENVFYDTDRRIKLVTVNEAVRVLLMRLIQEIIQLLSELIFTQLIYLKG